MKNKIKWYSSKLVLKARDDRIFLSPDMIENFDKNYTERVIES